MPTLLGHCSVAAHVPATALPSRNRWYTTSQPTEYHPHLMMALLFLLMMGESTVERALHILKKKRNVHRMSNMLVSYRQFRDCTTHCPLFSISPLSLVLSFFRSRFSSPPGIPSNHRYTGTARRGILRCYCSSRSYRGWAPPRLTFLILPAAVVILGAKVMWVDNSWGVMPGTRLCVPVIEAVHLH